MGSILDLFFPVLSRFVVRKRLLKFVVTVMMRMSSGKSIQYILSSRLQEYM